MPVATSYRGKYSICLCSAEKKARAQMKFNSQGGLGEGVKEGMWSSLHTLDACMMLLLANLLGLGNMSKPMLAVHESGVHEGVYRVSFDIMSFGKWEILESKHKLGVNILRDLELGSWIVDPTACSYGRSKGCGKLTRCG